MYSKDGFIKTNESSTNSLFSLSGTLTNHSSYLLNVMEDDRRSELPDFISSTINNASANVLEKNKFIVILVGLPATGKSTISSHLINFLKQKYPTKLLRSSVFNAGAVRRSMCKKKLIDDLFDPKNSNIKDEFAKITFNSMIDSINNDECDIGIFDATNSTKMRRAYVMNEIDNYNNDKNGNKYHLTPIIVQVSCSNRDFIRYNIHNKSFNEDYFDKPYEYAIKSFSKRLKTYYSQYNEVTDNELSLYSRLSNIRNLLFFEIIDAGTVKTNVWSIIDTESHAKILEVLKSSLNDFLENYFELYGHEYVKRVEKFFYQKSKVQINKNNDNLSAQFSKTNAQSRHSMCLTTLNTTVDRSFFKMLTDLKTKNETLTE